MSLLHPPGAPSAQPRGAVDLDRFRLRSYLAALGPDELEVRDEAIDLVDVARVFEGNPRAVLLRRVGPEGAELVGNVVRRRTGRLASRSHSALAFAATDHRGEPRPGTRPRGRPYRRRGRSDASPRP